MCLLRPESPSGRISGNSDEDLFVLSAASILDNDMKSENDFTDIISMDRTDNCSSQQYTEFGETSVRRMHLRSDGTCQASSVLDGALLNEEMLNVPSIQVGVSENFDSLSGFSPGYSLRSRKSNI